MTTDNQTSLSFWAIGDLHFRAVPAWNEFHQQRLSLMFSDLHDLWREYGEPLFIASPGDLVEMFRPEDYAVAIATIRQQFGNIPFYPGVGNHEYINENWMNDSQGAIEFQRHWGKPLRYSWTFGNALGIMLDYPDPCLLADYRYVYLSQETLAFLDDTLAAHPERPTVIFLHCPLRDTVLYREDEHGVLDYHSKQNFFSPENSQEVRAILARHRNACLVFSGHTHSGWETPNIVVTETLGEHPVTFVNLMSPWYTGNQGGPKVLDTPPYFFYRFDEPQFLPTFSVTLEQKQALIRVRDHQQRIWLKSWHVPLSW